MMGFFTGEWLLTRLRLANSGGIVCLRALITSAIIFAATLMVLELLDPNTTWAFSWGRTRVLVSEKLPWFGATFAATYAAFYARFSSQWNYLADLYNRIKEAQVSGVEHPQALAQWKAGFIEDAEDLHLATKPMFANVVRDWGNDPDVRKEFCSYTVGHQRRLSALLNRVRKSIARAERRYRRR